MKISLQIEPPIYFQKARKAFIKKKVIKLIAIEDCDILDSLENKNSSDVPVIYRNKYGSCLVVMFVMVSTVLCSSDVKSERQKSKVPQTFPHISLRVSKL